MARLGQSFSEIRPGHQLYGVFHGGRLDKWAGMSQFYKFLMVEHTSSFPAYSQLDGIFVLNKPSGPSSAQCLKIFKRFGQKKLGHAGTLDPLADGVLLVLLGQATKLSSWLLAEGKKTYAATVRLGIETDTWDTEGTVLARKPVDGITAEAIGNIVASLCGEQVQEVPAYSAAKFQGQPLYKLTRKGIKAPVKHKIVKIYKADLLSAELPHATFRVECSSGSYIRSLAHSLGQRLGCGAALCNLTREYSHPFSLAEASALEDLERQPAILPGRLLPLSAALPDWPKIQLTAEQAEAVRNGQGIRASHESASHAFLCRGDTPLALARLDDASREARWQVIRGLWN